MVCCAAHAGTHRRRWRHHMLGWDATSQSRVSVQTYCLLVRRVCCRSGCHAWSVTGHQWHKLISYSRNTIHVPGGKDCRDRLCTSLTWTPVSGASETRICTLSGTTCSGTWPESAESGTALGLFRADLGLVKPIPRPVKLALGLVAWDWLNVCCKSGAMSTEAAGWNRGIWASL